MAIYSFSGDVFTRSKGHRATAAAAYRAGVELYDHTIGERFDYHRKRGIVHSEILAPENAPEWMHDREALWNAVEKQENRSNSQLARDIMVALPHELDEAQRLALLRSFIRDQFVGAGMVADFSVHAPSGQGDERNHHAHIMLTLRRIDGDGFSKHKAREWNSKEMMGQWREAWADHCNDAFDAAGLEGVSVSHLSLGAQNIDRLPGEHKGKAATAAERKGDVSERAERIEETEARHREYDELIADLAAIEAQLAAQQEQRLDERYGAADEWPEQEEPAREPEPEFLAALPEADEPPVWLIDVTTAPREPGPALSQSELRQARDAATPAEAAGPAPYPESGWEPHAPGLTRLQRAAIFMSQVAEQARGLVRGTWQKYVSWRAQSRDAEPEGPDL